MLHVGVGREGRADSSLALGVELEQLPRHVGHRFFYAGLGLLPALRAEFVEFWWWTGLGRAVFLDEVEAREWDVEFRFVGELEDHEFERDAGVFFDDPQAAVTGDAVFDVDDVVADRQITEVGDERGGFGFSAANRTGRDVGVVGEVLRAEEDELASARLIEIEDLNAGRRSGS